MAYFRYNNQTIHYKIKGEGFPLLLLHGNTASSKMFFPVLKRYSKAFKVILIDFPGHGKSERINKFETDFWYYNSKVCKALLKELKINKTYVIGTSGGALVGINLALEYPELVKGLIADSFEGEYPLDTFVNSLVENRNEGKRSLFARLFWRYNHGKDWRKIVDLDTEMLLTFNKLNKSFFNKSISEIKVPTLLTGSLKDEYCDSLDMVYEDLKHKSSGLKIKMFQKGGHPAIISNKKMFYKLSKQWFN